MILTKALKTMRVVFAVITAAVVLAFSPTSGHAFQVLNKYEQPMSPDASGRNTVEAAVIHEIACNGVAENGGKFYVYQYLDRQSFKAIQPPNWSDAIGGQNYPTFDQAAAVACRGGPSQAGEGTAEAPEVESATGSTDEW